VRNEYIWLDDMPVAMVSAGTLYFIQPDHLGAAQRSASPMPTRTLSDGRDGPAGC